MRLGAARLETKRFDILLRAHSTSIGGRRLGSGALLLLLRLLPVLLAPLLLALLLVLRHRRVVQPHAAELHRHAKLLDQLLPRLVRRQVDGAEAGVGGRQRGGRLARVAVQREEVLAPCETQQSATGHIALWHCENDKQVAKVHVLAPLKPSSCAKPPAGVCLLPVANCSTSSLSSVSNTSSTASQNQRTTRERFLKPPPYSVCAFQSSVSMVGSPATSSWSSIGVVMARREWKTSTGMIVCKPVRNAAVCSSIPPNSRRSTRHWM